MMQRKIILSDKIDQARADRAFAKATKVRAIRASMLSMAAKNQPGERGWFALQVLTGTEETVQKLLENGNVEYALPIWKGGKKYRRGMLIVRPDKVAAPGYVFVRIVVSAAALAGLLRLDEVYGIVGGTERPLAIPDKSMSAFIAMCACGELPKDKASAGIEVGMAVAIKDGPFAKMEGAVLEVNAVAALLEITVGGNVVKVSMPIAFLLIR
jgi:transcriptional antiterminator NusG